MATTRKTKQAEILREYGPYPGIDHVHGVTFDGAHVWFARGESIVALDPGGGALVRELAVAADGGTAFDGEYLWQLADDRIQKVDPRSGQVVATIPAPTHEKGARDVSSVPGHDGSLRRGRSFGRRHHDLSGHQIAAQTTQSQQAT